MNKELSTVAGVNRPTLRMWRYFVLAVDLGSLLRAADAAGTDVSVVSRDLKALEMLIKEPLLNKTKRGVTPTWTGVMRYKQARNLLNSYEALFDSAGSGKRTEVIRMAVPSSMISLFVRWVAEFGTIAEGRNISIEVEQYSDSVVPDVMGFDYFICKDILPNVRVLAVQLGYMRNTIIASPEFLKTQPEIQTPEDLENKPLVAEKKGRVLMEGNGQSVSIWVDPVVRVNNASSLAEPAIAGLGYAVGVPYWQIQEALEQSKLQIVLPQWHIALSPVWLLHRPKRKFSKEERRLVQFLKDQWGKTPGLVLPRKDQASFKRVESHD